MEDIKVNFELIYLDELGHVVQAAKIYFQRQNVGFFEFSKKAELNEKITLCKQLTLKISAIMDEAEGLKQSNANLSLTSQEIDLVITAIKLFDDGLVLKKSLTSDVGIKQEIESVQKDMQTIAVKLLQQN